MFKKKYFINATLLLLLLFIFSGCQSESASKSHESMVKGLELLINEHYDEAENHFEEAYNHSKKEKYDRFYQQIVSYNKAEKLFEETKVEPVHEEIEKVLEIKDGSMSISGKAESLLEEIEKIEEQTESYEKEYEEILALHKNGENDQAIQLVFELLSENKIEESYYQEIYSKAKALKKEIKASIEEEAEKQLSAEKMRELAKNYVDEWNGYDNELLEEEWTSDGELKYYIFRDGDTDHHILGVTVDPATGEVKGDHGGID